MRASCKCSCMYEGFICVCGTNWTALLGDRMQPLCVCMCVYKKNYVCACTLCAMSRELVALRRCVLPLLLMQLSELVFASLKVLVSKLWLLVFMVVVRSDVGKQ